jgi:hypothetical protein
MREDGAKGPAAAFPDLYDKSGLAVGLRDRALIGFEEGLAEAFSAD